MSINFEKALGVHQYTMLARSKRAEVLAANIANADTPNYKAKDVDFQQLMKTMQRGQAGGSGGAISRTHEKHFAIPAVGQTNSLYTVPGQPDTGDGNTVDIQQERNKFLENSMEYQASVQFLGGKVKSLKKALSGQ